MTDDCSPFDRPWYADVSVLVRRPLEFFPARGMEPQELLNATVRFIVYAAIATSLYQDTATPLLFGCVCIIAVSLLFTVSTHNASYKRRYSTWHSSRSKEASHRSRGSCTQPTHDNPFMNVLTNEFGSEKPEACPQTPCITRKINSHFDHHTIRELTDVYKKRASDRQFVTMPVTGNGTPNTLAFRNYLFSQLKKGTRCK